MIMHMFLVVYTLEIQSIDYLLDLVDLSNLRLFTPN